MINYCTKCGSKMEGAYKFCPACGKKLSADTPLPPTFYLSFAVAALVLFAGPYLMNSSLIGEAPVDTQASLRADSASDISDPSDQVLDLLRRQAESAPQDKEGWRALGQEIFSRFAKSEHHPSPTLALTAIDAFSQVLKLDPNDTQATLALADISFAQQAFTKSAEFYGKYLALNPNDLAAKSKHASSLTFLGKFDQAVSELKEVLAKQPNDFHALAYLAITYAQMGKREEAMRTGNKAIEAAPTQEAKERFRGFLDSIANDEKAESSAPQANTTQEKISSVIQSNPIAGPKFINVKELGKGEFSVSMKDFPMDKMPPFAKQKFLDGLKQQLAGQKDLKRLQFVDAATGANMDELRLGE